MNIDELATLEYEALQAEKRDKMNSRLQVWSIFFGLVGAAGLASVQSSALSLLVGLYPLLAACLARHAGHSERVLTQVKARILAIEISVVGDCSDCSDYKGYEQENRELAHIRKSGEHLKALRDALVLTELLALAIVVWQLFTQPVFVVSQPALVIIVTLIELMSVVKTVTSLRDSEARR